MHQSDEQLILAYKNGDEHALTMLFGHNIKTIYRFIYSFVQDDAICSDLTQDTFVKVWKNIEKFDTDRTFKVWMYSIAKNIVFDYLKKKKIISFSNVSNDIDFENLIIDEESNAEEIFKRNEESEVIKELLKKIDIKYQLVISLHYFNELSLNEISLITDESINTIKSRHIRAIALLKKLLKDNETLN